MAQTGMQLARSIIDGAQRCHVREGHALQSMRPARAMHACIARGQQGGADCCRACAVAACCFVWAGPCGARLGNGKPLPSEIRYPPANKCRSNRWYLPDAGLSRYMSTQGAWGCASTVSRLTHWRLTPWPNQLPGPQSTPHIHRCSCCDPHALRRLVISEQQRTGMAATCPAGRVGCRALLGALLLRLAVLVSPRGATGAEIVCTHKRVVLRQPAQAAPPRRRPIKRLWASAFDLDLHYVCNYFPTHMQQSKQSSACTQGNPHQLFSPCRPCNAQLHAPAAACPALTHAQQPSSTSRATLSAHTTYHIPAATLSCLFTVLCVSPSAVVYALMPLPECR